MKFKMLHKFFFISLYSCSYSEIDVDIDELNRISIKDQRRNYINQDRVKMIELGNKKNGYIPDNSKSISNLLVDKNDRLYGISSGIGVYFFYYENSLIHPLGKVVVNGKIANGMTLLQNKLYFSVNTSNRGNLYMYNLESTKLFNNFEDMAQVENLVALPKGKFFHTINGFQEENAIYGLVKPSNDLIRIDLFNNSYEIISQVGRPRTGEMPLVLSRSLVKFKSRIYGVGHYGCFFRYDSSNHTFSFVGESIPALSGQIDFTFVDAMVVDKKGNIWGGTSAGYLFRYNTTSGVTTNLGKPLPENRIRGLVLTESGLLYGIGGDDDGIARLFSYNIHTHSYDLYGTVELINPHWTAFSISAMVMDSYENIYLGEVGRRAHIFKYKTR